MADIASWMYSSASAWLMTSLDRDPLSVSLIQAAACLPVFLLALPVGTLADIVDKRRLLIAAEVFIAIAAAALAVLVWRDLVTPALLLLFTFLIEAGAATGAPYQSIMPTLVPRDDAANAVAVHGVGTNVSRAVGSALGGVAIAGFGIAAPFFVNAVGNFGAIGALWRMRSRSEPISELPAERLGTAMRTGLRHARHNSALIATMARAVGFFLFASCYWALLPLVARHEIGGGPILYGLLLAAFGVGSIVVGFALPMLKTRLGANRLMAAGAMGSALALLLFGIANEPIAGFAASLIAGGCWIAVLSTLNASAQFALPEWVRTRGLAIYVTACFGVMTLGSALWGIVARSAGVPLTLLIAAAGGLLAVPLTRHWRLQTGANESLVPSKHWPAPVSATSIASDDGPILITVEYRIGAAEREPFLVALRRLSHERGRDGAYGWHIFEDIAEPGRFLETFFVESWIEHLRHHERVTNADRVLEQEVYRFARDTPRVTHLSAQVSRRQPGSHPPKQQVIR